MTSLKLDDGMNQCSVYFDEQSEKSFTATATHSHWVHYTHGAQPQSANFAEYTEGNKVQAFLGGKEYFSALLGAFKQATRRICITGWQVNWDAQLAEGVRLVDALTEAVQASPSLEVYIMPWACQSPVETWAGATERVFAAMNSHVKRTAFYVQCAGSKSDIFFSHHQKCVIIDDRLAFVGGIDLAYGRYDDNYGLQADANGRQGMNRYNPGVPAILPGVGYNPMEEYVISANSRSQEKQPHESENNKRRQAKSVQNIIDRVLDKGCTQSAKNARNCHYLDPSLQPRMPWQDYQVEIEGPAVDDLVKNFVRRWNSYSPREPASPLQTPIPKLTLPGAPSEKKGTCQVQVLRSASLNMCADEHKYMPEAAPEAHLKQDDILRSIHLLVSKAEHYIYIENQFFVSAFGKSSAEDKDPLSPVADNINPSLSAWATRILPDNNNPLNPVAEWLAERIKRAIFSSMPQAFHLYIVLPVHPEGSLADPTIVAQIHLTRQSLIFGSHSLLNRIRRSLWVKQQLEAQGIPRRDWYHKIPELEIQCGEGYKDIALELCDEYVTLLNLRDHAVLNGVAVTEQIYVHSKLMIVDDRYVLVGSANINDRSLMGDRDSELAVLISDTGNSYTDLDGSGIPAPCRNFARDLRQKAWRKWLGSAAEDCAEALDKPAIPAGWKKIQTLARENAENYEAVFGFIPRDEFQKDKGVNKNAKKGNKVWASVWPVLATNSPLTTVDEEKMPFSEKFWSQNKTRPVNDNSTLKNIKGFFTALPVHWTEGENNLIPYNMRLIAHNTLPDESETQIADNQDENRDDGEWS